MSFPIMIWVAGEMTIRWVYHKLDLTQDSISYLDFVYSYSNREAMMIPRVSQCINPDIVYHSH